MKQLSFKGNSITDKFNYFQDKANMELAMFTYLCYRTNELVLPLEFEPDLQKDTLLVA